MTAPLILMPDIDELVSAFLREQSEISGGVGDHVYTTIPTLREGVQEWRFPLVRVGTFDDDLVVAHVDWLAVSRLQIEAFGGPKDFAHDVAATCRAALRQRLPGVHDEAVVTGVRTRGFAYRPDPTFTPAKPRWLFVATIFAHPLPETGS